MGASSSVLSAENIRLRANEDHTSAMSLIDIESVCDVPDTPETASEDGEPILLNDKDSVRIFPEEMFIRHIDFLFKVSVNRIDVSEAERYISMYPEVLNITDSRGESVSSYALYNRNAGLSWLFARAKGK